MQKQIIYPKFVPRIFATTIDLGIMAIVFSPVMTLISRYVFILVFHSFFAANNIDINDAEAVRSELTTSKFINHMTALDFITYIVLLLVANLALMGFYFVPFWKKLGATPGKLLMGMRIVNSDDYSKPTLAQFIKRYCSYLFSFFSLWGMIFDKRGIALHDKIAGTVVIKN